MSESLIIIAMKEELQGRDSQLEGSLVTPGFNSEEG